MKQDPNSNKTADLSGYYALDAQLQPDAQMPSYAGIQRSGPLPLRQPGVTPTSTGSATGSSEFTKNANKLKARMRMNNLLQGLLFAVKLIAYVAVGLLVDMVGLLIPPHKAPMFSAFFGESKPKPREYIPSGYHPVYSASPEDSLTSAKQPILNQQKAGQAGQAGQPRTETTPDQLDQRSTNTSFMA